MRTSNSVGCIWRARTWSTDSKATMCLCKHIADVSLGTSPSATSFGCDSRDPRGKGPLIVAGISKMKWERQQMKVVKEREYPVRDFQAETWYGQMSSELCEVNTRLHSQLEGMAWSWKHTHADGRFLE